MRFERISIDKYGVYDKLELDLSGKGGLAIVYGPNEAGKSTCLSAVSDFLFGIPNNTTYGQVYGYDSIRLVATLRLANGQTVTLHRKKGRSRTLTDDNGKSEDEARLSSVLGAVNRERFAAVFGLDHNSLRIGGNQLLAAEGDIGRLIVEAGGGLSALVKSIEELREETDSLFAVRRSADRTFYKTLDAFDTADKEFREALVTRETYEQSSKAHQTAQLALEEHRNQLRLIREKQLDLQRLERVIPCLAELDRIDGEITSYSDVETLRADFAASVREALQDKSRTEESFRIAQESRAALAAELGSLVLSKAIVDAEVAIRDIMEKDAHVKKQRADRPRRENELDQQQRKLITLRQSVGIPVEVDIAPLLPSQDLLDKVQRLATDAIGTRANLEALDRQIEEDAATVAALERRQSDRAKSGRDKPLGVSASQFVNVVSLSHKLDAGRNEAQRQAGVLDRRVKGLGFTALAALQEFSCPGPAVIQAEIDFEASLEEKVAKQIQIISEQITRRDAAKAEIEKLKKGGEIPTAAAIAAARGTRASTWFAIRNVYLAEDERILASVPLDQRNATARTFESQVGDADQLADRKSVEAQRIAALDLAERELISAETSVAPAIDAKNTLAEKLTLVRNSFIKTWADAVRHEPDLGKLKLIIDERISVLNLADKLAASQSDIGDLSAEFDATGEAITSAEAELGIKTGQSSTVSERVQKLIRQIKAYEDFYSDYRSDQKALQATRDRLDKKRKELADLLEKQSKWMKEWKDAIAKLGLQEDVTPERGNEVATQWAAATGLIDSVKLTERRLKGMDEDENDLERRIAAVSSTLEFPLPQDCVAAAEMLKDKREETAKISTRRESLQSQLVRLAADRDNAKSVFGAAMQEVERFCKEASVVESGLKAIAERQEALLALHARRRQTLQTIHAAGDGIGIDELREAQGERNLDAVRIELHESQDKEKELTGTIEADIKTVQSSKQQLDRFEGDDRIIGLSAERERAIAEMHETLERYVELALARDLVVAAIDQIRGEQQDPLIQRVGELFSLATQGAFTGIQTDVDQKGNPIVVGKRISGPTVTVGNMSDGTRDQLFLAFRIASVEQYCAAAEPLPFIADDVLVHFDDDRSLATLKLLTELGKTTQVLLFTHHRSVRDALAHLPGSIPHIVNLGD